MKSETVTGTTKIVLGVVLPMFAFLIYDLLLFRSIGGKGEDLGAAGMMLSLGSFIIVPGLFMLNAAIMIRPWKTKLGVLFAGVALPTVVAIAEFVYVYGG